MLPLIYTNAVAAALFVAACLIWLVPEAISMPRQMAKARRAASRVQDRGSLLVLLGLQWAGLVLNFALAGLFPAGALGGPRAALFGLALAAMLLGVALRGWSIRTLGQYFTRDVAVSADQPVVTRGPYRWVRHPAYSGVLLTMLGVGLAAANWASLAALLACVFIGYSYRVRVEEAALLRALGQPYRDYMRRTRRFIPGVI